MSEQRFRLGYVPFDKVYFFDMTQQIQDKNGVNYFFGDLDEWKMEDTIMSMSNEQVVGLLNEQQSIIEELKTHNLQHFLEWLVIKGYVTDEPMKDINNVIDCVNKFKEYLTELDKITEINNEIGFDNDG